MSRRRIWIPTAIAAALFVGALAAFGARGIAARTYALDAPNQATVAVLRPSSRVCEGPVTAQGPVRSVDIWGSATGEAARLTVTAQDPATQRTLSSGELTATTVVGGYGARLGRTLPSGRPLRICLTDTAGSFVLSGSAAVHPNVVMTGANPGQEFSLVLMSDASRSLWSWLPLAFSRASLWRPSWVGSWTFWVLTAGLLGCFAIAVLAVARAASADDPPGAHDGFDGASSPPSRSGGERTGTGRAAIR